MKKLVCLFVSTLTFSLQAFAGECFTDCCPSWCNDNLFICGDIGAGYRQDNLKWAFPGFSPGLSIHEKWSNVNIGYIEANARVVACCQYIWRLDLDYGWSGSQKNHRVTFKDYNSNIDTELSKTSSRARVYDVSTGIGYKLDLDCYCPDLSIAPFVGWSFNHQQFKNAPFYRDSKHTSNYYWTSPWAGFETSYRFCCDWIAYFDYSFHFGHFHAKIDEFFRSRKHQVRSFGNEFEIGTIYSWCECWKFGLKFNYKDYWTKKVNSTYEAEFGGGHKRRVQWNSYSIGVDAGYCF